MTPPRFGWYGDDFTGATDTLAVVARAGLRSMLFMGVPDRAALAAAGPLDAVGIAGAARAMAPDAMRAELAAVGRFFRDQAPPVLHYKVCSTFDSAPQVGNIACAIETLRPFVDHPWVPIVGGQPSLGRYCAFSHLFAAAGTGGAVHRIDRHPTMRRHPVTPMGESDLRLHLAQQGLRGIASLHYPQYADAPGTLDAAVDALVDASSGDEAGLAPMLLDLTEPGQLATVGRLLWQQARRGRLLAVGSSAVAQALVAHWAETPNDAPLAVPPAAASGLARAKGPVLALAGSLSPLTAAQVQAATAYQRIAVDAHGLADDGAYAQALHDRICAELAGGRHVLAHTAPADGQAAGAPAPARVAQASAALVARVVQTRIRHGVPLRRIGIAGGDTSSHAVQALGLQGLSYQATISPGVTLSRAHSADPARDGLELMLKGGQMGAENLFGLLLGHG